MESCEVSLQRVGSTTTNLNTSILWNQRHGQQYTRQQTASQSINELSLDFSYTFSLRSFLFEMSIRNLFLTCLSEKCLDDEINFYPRVSWSSSVHLLQKYLPKNTQIRCPERCEES